MSTSPGALQVTTTTTTNTTMRFTQSETMTLSAGQYGSHQLHRQEQRKRHIPIPFAPQRMQGLSIAQTIAPAVYVVTAASEDGTMDTSSSCGPVNKGSNPLRDFLGQRSQMPKVPWRAFSPPPTMGGLARHHHQPVQPRSALLQPVVPPLPTTGPLSALQRTTSAPPLVNVKHQTTAAATTQTAVDTKSGPPPIPPRIALWGKLLLRAGVANRTFRVCRQCLRTPGLSADVQRAWQAPFATQRALVRHALHLPIQPAALDSALLLEVPTNEPLVGCNQGARCAGLAGLVAGGPRGGRRLLQSMTVTEHQAWIRQRQAPAVRRPCKLCERQLAGLILHTRRSFEIPVDPNDLWHAHRNAWNVVGGYDRRYAQELDATSYEGFIDPPLKPCWDLLKWIESRQNGSSVWAIDQSRLLWKPAA